MGQVEEGESRQVINIDDNGDNNDNGDNGDNDDNGDNGDGMNDNKLSLES